MRTSRTIATKLGGGQGQCQERLSPELAQSVKVCAKKGRKYELFDGLLCYLALLGCLFPPAS